MSVHHGLSKAMFRDLCVEDPVVYVRHLSCMYEESEPYTGTYWERTFVGLGERRGCGEACFVAGKEVALSHTRRKKGPRALSFTPVAPTSTSHKLASLDGLRQ